MQAHHSQFFTTISMKEALSLVQSSLDKAKQKQDSHSLKNLQLIKTYSNQAQYLKQKTPDHQ